MGFTMPKAGPTFRAFSGPTKVRDLEQHVWRREAWGVHESHQDIGRLQVAVHPLHLMDMREARCHLTSYPHTCHRRERPPPSPQEALEVKVGCLKHQCRLPFISTQMQQLHKVRVLQGTKGCHFRCTVGLRLQEFSREPLACYTGHNNDNLAEGSRPKNMAVDPALPLQLSGQIHC